MNRNMQEEMRKLHKENLEYLERQRKARAEYRIFETVSRISLIVLIISVIALDSDSWIPVIVASVSACILFLSLMFNHKLDF